LPSNGLVNYKIIMDSHDLLCAMMIFMLNCTRFSTRFTRFFSWQTSLEILQDQGCFTKLTYHFIFLNSQQVRLSQFLKGEITILWEYNRTYSYF